MVLGANDDDDIAEDTCRGPTFVDDAVYQNTHP